jgi:alpha-galactosidase
MLRRQFLTLSVTTFAAAIYSKLTYTNANGVALINYPDEVWAKLNDQWVKMTVSNGTFNYQDIQVTLKIKNSDQAVYVEAASTELQGLRLVWKYDTANNTKILGDHWERSYGDLAWKTPQADAKNPWYVLLNDGSKTACFGVKTGANAICWWTVKNNALELTMDTHSGGVGVKLGGRKLHAASITTMMSTALETPYATATRFCMHMCDKPILPKMPVYGINDWYVAYGNNSAKSIVEQTSYMSDLARDAKNRPFSVIDDGWQVPDDFATANNKFKDMHKVADEIKKWNMRPALWTRPLIAKQTDSATLLAPKIPGRNNPKELILDPTLPETIARIKFNMGKYKEWGYEMVKHDYSTYDIFGKWGFRMTDSFTQPGWKFYDQSKTNAEIINDLYRAIRKSAGNMYIIGCNTISHLSAGLFELNRIGDDTSGKEWARTKKMGVNTLGFRLPQHNTFYAADGDCVGLTKDVPWEKNKQWMQLLAESGSPLFISAQIEFLDESKKAAIRLAFDLAAKIQPTGEPLDWMDNQWPTKWKLNGRVVDFDWG